MARFYPQLTPDQLDFHGSLAEEKVYRKLESLPDRVRVFHSYQWSTRIHHRYRKDGEADFIIYDPQYGILVLEVKGGGISHRDGLWWQEDSAGRRQLSKGPWEQAMSSVYFLMNHIQSKAMGVSIPVHACLWFPDTNLPKVPSKNLPVNIPPYAVMDKVALEESSSMESTLSTIWSQYKADYNFPLNIPAGFNEKIVEMLLPNMNLVSTRNLSADESERIFYRLTKEQFKILEFIEDQRKVAIGGGAGSGKTMIAKEQALRLAQNGEKTLFLVYNSALQEDLVNTISHENLNILTWGKLAYAHAEKNKPDIMSAELVDKICNHDFDLLYKNIVIDEAQDFHSEWIQALDWSSELQEGGMYIFYDNRQDIQGDEGGILDWVANADTKLTINRNCRNTTNIAKTAHAFLGESPPKMLDDIEGPKPIWIECSQSKDEFVKILETVSRKLAENYPPEELTLVSLGVMKYSALGGAKYIETKIQGKKINCPVKESREKGSILKTTVRKFKGLESQVVILSDLSWGSADKWDDADEQGKIEIQERQAMLSKELYTAISRSKREVILVTKPLPDRLVWNGEVYSKEEFRKYFCETYHWVRG